MKNKTILYIWLGVYILTVIFGFIPPESTALRVFQILLSCGFFVMPGWLLVNAFREKNRKLFAFLQWVSGFVLIIAFALLLASILSIAAPDGVGIFLQILLTLLAPPLASGGLYALDLFFWACIFFTALSAKKLQKS